MLRKSRLIFYKIALIFYLTTASNSILAITLNTHIHGVDSTIEQLLKNELTLYSASNEPKLSKERINTLYDLTESEITDVLESNGYYNFTIKKRMVQRQEHFNIYINIEPGQQVIITKSKFTVLGAGKKDIVLQKSFFESLKLIATNKTFSHENYEDAKSDILKILTKNGYLKAKLISAVVQLDRDANTAEINISIDTGERFKFGVVLFASKEFKESLLKRYIPFKEGDNYTLMKLNEFHKNLESSEFFEKIRIDTIPDMEAKIVSILARLEAKPQSKYYANIGFGSNTGLRAGAGWRKTLRQASGHKISTNIGWSEIKLHANANYIIPGKIAANDQYIFSANILEERIAKRYSLITEITAIHNRRRNNFGVDIGIEYFSEKYYLNKSEPTKFKKFLFTSFKINRYKDNDYKINLFARLAHNKLASDGTVAFFEMHNRKIFMITENQKFIISNQLGIVFSKDFESLPPKLRFFAGGDYSIRGYKYKSLGPSKTKIVDNKETTIVTGGKYMAILNLEYEIKVYNDISLALFHDLGNTFNDVKNIIAAKSLGMGLRYQTPVGSIRLDVAKPLTLSPNKSFRIHLSFGADF